MTYQQLLAAYQASHGGPGSSVDGDAFNAWTATLPGAENGWEGITGTTPVTGTTPGGGTTPTGGVGGTDLTAILAELNLDPDFAALPDAWKQQIAQVASAQGLAAAVQAVTTAAASSGDAAAKATLARWTQKANANAGAADTGGTTLPIEQDILNQYLGGLLSDADADAVRKQLVAKLGEQAVADFESARNALSPEENARRLAEELAHADETTNRLTDSSAGNAAAQLKALQDSIAAMQQNLTGDLATKAKALQDQIASLLGNLDTLDASQRAAIGAQIDGQQKGLETAIAAQQKNLTTQMDSLRGAVDAQSAARRQALQDELDGLTAAQAPMAQARLDSANALSSAINLGLQSTTDSLDAQRAKQGYLGSSTFDQNALARATIQARQGAAQALGSARELNANDTRAIGAQGATEGRSIADELANNRLNIDTNQAAGTRSLADLLATGTQGLGDDWLKGNAAITNSTAAGRFNIGNTGATQNYNDQVFGADQQRALADALAKGAGGIASTASTQAQAARDQGTLARQSYFDNAYTRGQGGILSRATLGNNLAGNLTALDNYGNSGLNRLLGTLNWWATGGQQAPITQTVPVTADNSGNDIAGLGAGVLGSALKLGSANSWWQTPKATSPVLPTGYGSTDI